MQDPQANAADYTPTYEIVARDNVRGFKCLICQRISYNKNDIANLYCGHCHVFHKPAGMLDLSHFPYLLGGCS